MQTHFPASISEVAAVYNGSGFRKCFIQGIRLSQLGEPLFHGAPVCTCSEHCPCFPHFSHWILLLPGKSPFADEYGQHEISFACHRSNFTRRTEWNCDTCMLREQGEESFFHSADIDNVYSLSTTHQVPDNASFGSSRNKQITP